MAKRVSVDGWLFTVTLILVFVGLVMVFSASAVMAKERYGSGYFFSAAPGRMGGCRNCRHGGGDEGGLPALQASGRGVLGAGRDHAAADLGLFPGPRPQYSPLDS